MSGEYRSQRRTACWWLLRLASALVPQDVRAEWLRHRDSSLYSLYILADRGELPGSDFAVLAWWCRDVVANAFLMRCREFDARQWTRRPAFPIAAACVALLVISAASHGLAATRLLLHPLDGTPAMQLENRLMANLFPIAFALAVSVMAAFGRVSLAVHNWRYDSFLLLKTLLLMITVSLLWIEGGAALRGAIPNQTVRVLAGGLVLAVLFVATFGCVVLWSLADQRHRCPACLRRLVFPVRIGSWGSVFEPVTTEWICEAGHGSLCVCEVEADDHWLHLTSAPTSG